MCFSFPLENAGVSDLDLFEGDMIISTDQRMAAEKGLDIDNPLGRASTKNKQWPGGLVPYIIASEICKCIAVTLNKGQPSFVNHQWIKKIAMSSFFQNYSEQAGKE